MDVDPKYIKFEKASFLSRIINAGRTLVDAFLNAQGFFLHAPLNALEAFTENEVEVIDKQLMLKDAQNGSEDGEVIKLQIDEPEEPWQKKHREMYEKDDD